MARILLIVKPAGLLQSDGKQRDGCTITPLRSGHPLAWKYSNRVVATGILEVGVQILY